MWVYSIPSASSAAPVDGTPSGGAGADRASASPEELFVPGDQHVWGFEVSHDPDLDWLREYALIQSHRGRPLHAILDDPHVVERCSADTRRRLLDQPDVVAAVGHDVVERLRELTARPLPGARGRRAAPGVVTDAADPPRTAAGEPPAVGT
jgi:hypothetical protein